MTRGILIAGNESSLLSAVGNEAAKRVDSYAMAFIPRGTAAIEEPDRKSPVLGKTQIPLEWNPGSPISSRTLILAAQNRLGHIDDAILVCAPPAIRRPPEELVPVEIDRIINDQIKGWFFLVRELIVVFKARKSGTLTLALSDVAPGAREELPDLLGAPAAASFRAFVQNLLISSLNEPYQIMGFSSAESGEDPAFAAYIFKLLEDSRKNSGKWYKYGKRGIFGR
jgi:NAD(P)-dependent dehydrogenase (short-subunit alcohol dehydrogenase family)